MSVDVNEVNSINELFINSVIQKKYCHRGEKSLSDIKKRFMQYLEKLNYKSIFTDGRPFSDILFDTFMPGGSILYGFGANKNVSLSNCYYVPINDDSIDGIGNAIKENMKVFSWRGGVGNSFEILRPKGTPVNNAAQTSTGSVSFMPLFSSATQTIGQNGRRGASIFTHAVWHPDVIDFIKSKAHPEEVFAKDALNNTLPKITGANISVKLTKSFIDAVKNDGDWQLVYPDMHDPEYKNWDGDLSNYKGKIKVYKTLKAKEIMQLIAKSAWEYAEPGVLFWDTVMDNTPMAVIPELRPKGVNPCGEQILANYDSCNLASVVLYRYVVNPFTKDAYFNFELFASDIYKMVEFMDIVIDVNTHPLPQQTQMNQFSRKIGLGITGLADCLAMLNLTYGSTESIEMTERIMLAKAYHEIKASIELSKAKGFCPALSDKNTRIRFAEHKYFANIESKMQEPICEEIAQYGLRNVGLSTIAPTGSTSIIANNCTSGIEPLFALEYYRKSNISDQVRIIHPVLFNYIALNNPKDLELPKEKLLEKYHYVEAESLNYKQRIDMQAVCQQYVTDSISSTVNLPQTVTIDDIEKLYLYAADKGLKGITVYRSGCSLGGILTTAKDEPKKDKVMVNAKEKSIRYRVKWKNTIKTYITVTIDDQGNPIEVFTKVPKEAGLEKDSFNPALYLERQSYWDSLCRLISLDLRYQIPLEDIVKQLDKSSYSMYDLAAILKRTLLDSANAKYKKDAQVQGLAECPSCGEKSYVKENGCGRCLSCGYSKCD